MSVPAAGWAHVRVASDNPGVWLMHCHIDWHMAAGLVLTVVEGEDVLARGHIIVPPAQRNMNCATGGHGAISHN